jgi:hypothetical protein
MQGPGYRNHYIDVTMTARPGSGGRLRRFLTVAGAHPALWTLGTENCCFPWDKAAGRQAVDLSSVCVKIERTWSPASTPPHVFITSCLINRMDEIALAWSCERTLKGCARKQSRCIVGNVLHAAVNGRTLHSFHTNPVHGTWRAFTHL